MDTLRVWTGGTDTSLPDFSTPIGGTIGTPPTTQSNFSSYLPSSSSLRSSVPSWVPFVGGADASQQDNDCLPSLSWTQRIICFAALLLIGIVFTAFVRSFSALFVYDHHGSTTYIYQIALCAHAERA